MLVYIHQLGGNFATITPVSAVDPGYGMPTVPHPGQGLPHPPHFPSNTLPSGPPPHVQAGATLVLVRDPVGVWHYAAIPAGQPVPTPLPELPPTTAAPKA